MRFSVFISGLVCSVALLSSNQVSALQLDQHDADYLVLSQKDGDPAKPAKQQPQEEDIQTGNFYNTGKEEKEVKAPAPKKEKEDAEDEDQDCDKLGKEADKCRGDKINERRLINEKRDKEWRLKQQEYYRNQQEQIRIKN